MPSEGSSVSGPPPDSTAQDALLLWQRVDAALSPIIGRQGVLGLYKRSLYLSRERWPCLAVQADAGAGADTGPDPAPYAGLQAVLARLSPGDARDAQAELLLNFCRLLGSLVGVALAGQLLAPAGVPAAMISLSLSASPTSSGAAAQDIPR